MHVRFDTAWQFGPQFPAIWLPWIALSELEHVPLPAWVSPQTRAENVQNRHGIGREESLPRLSL